MGSADDNGSVAWRDGTVLPQLHQSRQGHPGVWAVEHPRPVGQCCRVHELLLRGLLNDAIAVLQSLDGAVNAHWVSYLDGGCQWAATPLA